ncbi:type III ribulose-bisphosphate carboxylase [archaeon]|jgi:ribulose-bisphosphate carboxylase large chain|nr:type III ribulose-bisphosphate carboxylase [Candidatus Woesearchaeota archaeon]MBT4135875.1 type III ribulose-bisphosphate carboxylase [archaeon]MBT4242235.1 type III ribulose-bisphosphate carboxylase [archaeon]MBT4417923.1 type III ribulose-bisphosphate carboxylase [archaeon]
MKPAEFVNLKYKPSRKDLVCLFRVKPNKMTMREAAATVALESSVGTWTDVHEKKYVNKLAAKVFSINKNMIKIAYPQDLFERGNAPNILSSIAGNIFGMKAVKSIRLEDIKIPKDILDSFKGPKYGIEGVRKIMKVKNRPLVGTIVKPKLGLKTKDHTELAFESWKGGCDVVKDDENLSSQTFNKFEKRLTSCLEVADKAKSHTSEEKAYLINVTAETKKMLKRAELVEDQGGKYIMVDIVTCGFSALQTLREANFKMAIHAHRAMHAAFTRDKEQGMSMMVLADIARLIGVDQLHIGTAVGKLEGSLEEVSEISEEIEKKNVKATKRRLAQDWGKIKSVLSVSSGGLHPGHAPFLIKNLGKDIVIQAGGGIHGHPNGTFRGAIAMRQAVDATMRGISLKEYSKKHIELRDALEFWKKK